MHLHREIGDLADHLGAEQLRHRRRDAPVGVVHPRPRRVAHQRPPGHDAGLLVGDHRLDQLEVPDRGAALRRGRGVGDGLVECALRLPDRQRRDVHPAAGQRGHRRAVAHLAVAAHEGLGPDADTGETDVGGA